MCYYSGLIEGKHQTIDSTLVKANASLDSLEIKKPKLTVEEYIYKTYQENKPEEDQQSENPTDEQTEQRESELTIQKKPKTNRSKKKAATRIIRAAPMLIADWQVSLVKQAGYITQHIIAQTVKTVS